MVEFHLTDNTPEVLNMFSKQAQLALEACGLHGEKLAKGYCPVDTGRLRNSISHVVNLGQAVIGTNVEYAPYVELGTSRQKPQPYLRPAALNHSSEYRAIFERYFREIT